LEYSKVTAENQARAYNSVQLKGNDLKSWANLVVTRDHGSIFKKIEVDYLRTKPKELESKMHRNIECYNAYSKGNQVSISH